jgi:putative aminopeptidase FrvX
METAADKSTDVQPERLKSLLKALVDIYSPSGKEEGIVEYVEDYL